MPKKFDDLTAAQKRRFEAQLKAFGIPANAVQDSLTERGPRQPVNCVFKDLADMKSVCGVPENLLCSPEADWGADWYIKYPPSLFSKDRVRQLKQAGRDRAESLLTAVESSALNAAVVAYLHGVSSKVPAEFVEVANFLWYPKGLMVDVAREVTVSAAYSAQQAIVCGTLTIEAQGYLKVLGDFFSIQAQVVNIVDKPKATDWGVNTWMDNPRGFVPAISSIGAPGRLGADAQPRIGEAQAGHDASGRSGVGGTGHVGMAGDTGGRGSDGYPAPSVVLNAEEISGYFAPYLAGGSGGPGGRGGKGQKGGRGGNAAAGGVGGKGGNGGQGGDGGTGGPGSLITVIYGTLEKAQLNPQAPRSRGGGAGPGGAGGDGGDTGSGPYPNHEKSAKGDTGKPGNEGKSGEPGAVTFILGDFSA